MGRFRQDRLLEARVGLELTQEEAAAAIGIEVRTYRRYETGAVNHPRRGFSIRHPSRRRLIERMAAELGMSLRDLFEEDREEAEEVGAVSTAVVGPHVLPPAPGFVGRADLLEELSTWARSGAPGVRALVAPGGAGKTSLAEQVVSRSGAAFVWSFYQDERSEAMLDAALSHPVSGAVAARPARAEEIEAALRRRGGLLVLDGLEIVQADGRGARARGEIEDAALRRLLRACADGSGQARILITTRFFPVDLAPWDGRGFEAISLGDLSPAESEALLAHFQIEHPRAIAERFGGHPLSLAVAGGYVRAFLDGDANRLTEIDLLEASQDDPLARRLAGMVVAYAASLPPLERDVLSRLAVFPRGATAGTLAAVARAGGEAAGALAGTDTAAIGRALARLVTLGIASRSGRAVALHPFVAQIAKRGLGRAEAAIHEVEAGRLAGLLAGRPSEPPSDRTALDRLEDLLIHLLGAGCAVEAAALYRRGLGGFAQLGLALGEMSRGARITRALEAAVGPWWPLARVIVYDRGLYAGGLGDLDQALSSYQTYCAGAREHGDLAALTTGLRTTAYTERLAGNLGAALDSIRRAEEVAMELDWVHRVRAIALRAAIEGDRGELDEAGRLFAQVRELGDEPLARRGLWEAEHLIALGRLDEARSLTERNRARCEERGWPGHTAHCHAVLGQIAARMDEESAARGHLALVEAWAARAGEVEMVLRAHELRGSLPLGERAAAEGALKAERLGFGLFHVRLLRLANRGAEADRRARELGYAG